LVKSNYPTAKFVAVMPCYDKKLEAVRPMMEDGRMEVDTVLATHELIGLLQKVDLVGTQTPPPAPINQIVSSLLWAETFSPKFNR
jgi:iron only hydrogenase large subunit-like protein